MADFIIRSRSGKYVHNFVGHSTVSVSDKKDLAKKYPSLEAAQEDLNAHIAETAQNKYEVIPLDEQLMKEASKPMENKYVIKYKTMGGKQEYITGWKGRPVLKPVFETTKDPIKADKFDTEKEAQKVLERLAYPEHAEIVPMLYNKTSSENNPKEEDKVDPLTDKVLTAAIDKLNPEKPKNTPDNVKQYSDIHDTKIPDLNPGSTEIWYLKPYAQIRDLNREYTMGSKWLIQRGIELPHHSTLSRTHICVGKVQCKNKDKLFHLMQGEIWSPRGEARNLITSLGLDHTSMSVGDILVVDGVLFLVDRMGFYEITGNENNTTDSQNKKASSPNMPYAVNTLDFIVGDVVRKMYNGRDVSPFTGTVVRVDSASNKVDVEFPMGTERCAPEEIIKQNAIVFPPNTTSVRATKRKIRAALTKADLESAAETLLNAGYSEDEAIAMLSEGMESNLVKQAALRDLYRKVASRMPILSLVTNSGLRMAAIYDTYKGMRIAYEKVDNKWKASCSALNIETELMASQQEARQEIRKMVDSCGKELAKAATAIPSKKVKFKKDVENLFKKLYAASTKEDLLGLADQYRMEIPTHYGLTQLRFWIVNFLNKVEKDIEDNPNITPNNLPEYILRYQKEI